MKQLKSILWQSALVAGCLLSTGATAEAKATVNHTFEVGQGTFLLDGKPFVIKAAEMHYMRIPRPYWEHRIQMAKALGMNAVCIYIFWNQHEQQEGVYDFETDERNVAEFVRLCQKNDMWVIVRPGPYVCAEWEMGGLPWWLLKHDDMKLRSLDKNFMTAVGRFERALAKQLEPFRLENGGNILMVQVENEYGSYAKDKPYVSAVRDSLRAAGWDKTQLFQCDWSSNFTDNALPDLLWTMNFGTGANIEQQFKKVGEMRPDAPKMCSEFWSGWFDGWGTAHQTRPADKMVQGIKDMLERGISFSLYMTHGGTSFGQWAGANNTGFAPDCTSYDYDAPINEQGAATEKYYKLRDLLQQYSDKKLPNVPKAKPVVPVNEFVFNEFAPLYAPENLPKPQAVEDIHSMEYFDQGYGSILYSCQLPETQQEGLLTITEVCDFASVFIDGQLLGRLYRGNKFENTLRVPTLPKGGKLDIMIEAMGRINYSKLIHDRKGITDKVELCTRIKGAELTYNLKEWEVTLLPFDYDFMASRHYGALEGNTADKAGYYKTTFKVSKVGDTYLDMSTWSKGIVWINGHCLGRFWNVGPQQTLYVPGCWLKKGQNEIIVMDIVGPAQAKASGVVTPVLDGLHREFLPKDGFRMETNSKNKFERSQLVGNDAAPGAK
ncbi:MAG: beta-galactosidase [Bacteroidales bacterium]|nr:beta-galactosidase [Bacteroidales bacterium]